MTACSPRSARASARSAGGIGRPVLGSRGCSLPIAARRRVLHVLYALQAETVQRHVIAADDARRDWRRPRIWDTAENRFQLPVRSSTRRSRPALKARNSSDSPGAPRVAPQFAINRSPSTSAAASTDITNAATAPRGFPEALGNAVAYASSVTRSVAAHDVEHHVAHFHIAQRGEEG